MILYNIDNDYLSSHRYGWHKIILQLETYIKTKLPTSDIILIDFMDKYFNLWFELPKIITCNNITYNFINKDAYYHINDNDKNDVFINIDEYNIYTILKWFPEYNEFKVLKGELIHNFKKKINVYNIDKPWIGILHYPEFVKEMNYNSYESLHNILKSTLLTNSIKHCKCIITLSNNLKLYVEQILKDNNYNIPIKVIYHPTDFMCKKFNLRSFMKNLNKKIIQIGFWMRKATTIYNINTNKFIKYWLPGGKYWKDMFFSIYPNFDDFLANSSVSIKMNLSNKEYDNLLSNNIVLLDVFNSSANNTVLECIARNTPLLVNKHPAIIEYLGIDYPLYFYDIDNLNSIINSDQFINLIISAYKYLKNMNKEKYTINFFCKSFEELLNEIS